MARAAAQIRARTRLDGVNPTSQPAAFEADGLEPEAELQSVLGRSVCTEGVVGFLAMLIGLIARTQYNHLALYSDSRAGAPLVALLIARGSLGFICLGLGAVVWWTQAAVVSERHRNRFVLLLILSSILNLWTAVATCMATARLEEVAYGTNRSLVSAQIGIICFALLADQIFSVVFVVGLWRLGDVVEAERPEQRMNRRQARRAAAAVASGRGTATDMDPDYWDGDERRRAEHTRGTQQHRHHKHRRPDRARRGQLDADGAFDDSRAGATAPHEGAHWPVGSADTPAPRRHGGGASEDDSEGGDDHRVELALALSASEVMHRAAARTQAAGDAGLTPAASALDTPQVRGEAAQRARGGAFGAEPRADPRAASEPRAARGHAPRGGAPGAPHVRSRSSGGAIAVADPHPAASAPPPS